MVQASFFHKDIQPQIVNVASVPHRSPFRYPGGKTWLVPRIRQWLVSLSSKPREFIEPFAGGGIIGLTVAFEELADHVIMVELDDEVAAVWKTILDSGADWLANRIINFDLTLESVMLELSKPYADLRDKAFRTILKNRVNRGGILAPGAGVIKEGENGKGIRSRWYPKTLQKRILDIELVKESIQFIEDDGMHILTDMCQRTDAVFFIDPPYTAAGKRSGTRLYKYNEIDHQELFRIADSLKGDFLMTYDHNNDVVELAHTHRFDMIAIPMKNTHHAKMTELLIGRNLDWVR